MAKEVKTEILINAKPEKIWAILTEFKAYPSWNPFIKSIEGIVALGNKPTVKIAPPQASAQTFKPTILAYEPNKELRWLGRFLITGIFDGEHKFELIDNGNGTTTFKHSEYFKGILVPLLSKMLDVNTRNGFEMMNKALKSQAER